MDGRATVVEPSYPLSWFTSFVPTPCWKMAQTNLGGGNGKANTYNRDVSRGRPCTAAPSPAKEEYEHNHNCARAYLAWPFLSEAHATIWRVPSTTGIVATALSCLEETSAASARNLPVVESAPGGSQEWPTSPEMLSPNLEYTELRTTPNMRRPIR
jgi:hypothetical protein